MNLVPPTYELSPFWHLHRVVQYCGTGTMVQLKSIVTTIHWYTPSYWIINVSCFLHDTPKYFKEHYSIGMIYVHKTWYYRAIMHRVIPLYFRPNYIFKLEPDLTYSTVYVVMPPAKVLTNTSTTFKQLSFADQILIEHMKGCALISTDVCTVLDRYIVNKKRLSTS